MPKCTVCHHPQHLEINQAILSKDFTLAVLSQKYGLHPSSLQRHKNHIESRMSRSLRRLREIREQGSLLLLNDILEQVRRNIAAADAQGNYLAVFRGSHVASRLIHQMGRVEGDMQPDTLHRLISSPAWVPGAGLLPTDPKLMTGLHQGLLDGAFAPCPEPATEISDDSVGRDPQGGDSPSAAPPAFRETAALSDVAPTQKTRNSKAGLATLRRLLPDLDLTLDDLPLRTGKLPTNQRKISEKAAANTPLDTEKDQQYQDITPNEKNLPKNPVCAPKTANAASAERESTRRATRHPQGGEAQAPPAVLENDLSPAVSATAAPLTVSAADTFSAIAAGKSAPAALAPFSEILYYPYLSAPETINPKPHPVFFPPAADNSMEILPKPRAAGVATFLKKFASYAGQTRFPVPDPPSAPKNHASCADR